MTETADADATGTNTGLKALVWGFRFVQVVLVGFGIILTVGALQMPGLSALVVLALVAILWVLALVIEMLAVRTVKGRA